MRIVITSNGSNIIKGISLSKISRTIDSQEFSSEPHTKKVKSLDKSYSSIESSNKNKKEKEENKNDISISSSVINIDDIGTSVNPPNIRTIKLSHKKLNIPSNMIEKYSNNTKKVPYKNLVFNEKSEEKETENIIYEAEPTKNEDNLIPDVFQSIEKSMNSGNKLPEIRKSYPLKYIINPNSYVKLQKDANEHKNYLIKKNIKINDNFNNFRSLSRQDPNIEFEINTNKGINCKNRNLIEYLNTDSTISNKFIAKLNQYNEDKMSKLNKICQKAFFHQNEDIMIKDIIKKRIKGEKSYQNDYCKSRLSEMKNDLDKSNNIFYNAKIYPKYDKRDRYMFQYKEAQDNWKKYNTQRFYKKSSPPIIKDSY